MITPAGRIGACTSVLVLVVSVPAPSRGPAIAQTARIELSAALDAYAQGRHDEALAAVRQASPGAARGIREQIVLRGTQWVDAVPADRPRRVLAAAAFALELEWIRAERGEWRGRGEGECDGPCVIEWACTLLQTRGAADDDERLWMRASIALAGGVRAWSFLQFPIAPPSEHRVEGGHVHHALGRFPDEPRFRLARLVALASRNAVTAERDTPGGSDPPRRGAIAAGPAFLDSLRGNRTRLTAYVSQELETLAGDASVGAEAGVRLGYVRWVDGDGAGALSILRAAAESTTEPDLTYVAHVLAAQAAQSLDDLQAADAHYRAALAVRPHSQSATLGLAALLSVRGDGREAYDMVAASRSHRPRDDDPWRLFLYGDFLHLPALVAELRQRVGRP